MTTGWWDSAQQLARVSSTVQWLLVISALLTAALTVSKLVVGNRLDELKAERTRLQATQLQVTQDDLRNARVKIDALEASQRPRKLTASQISGLVTDLSKFRGQKIDLSAHTEDHESLDLALQLQKVFLDAGWEQKGVGFAGFPVSPGIWIWYEPKSTSEPAALRLIDRMEELGLKVNIMLGVGDPTWIVFSTGRKKD
jgi:hypothetical protein